MEKSRVGDWNGKTPDILWYEKKLKKGEKYAWQFGGEMLLYESCPSGSGVPCKLNNEKHEKHHRQILEKEILWESSKDSQRKILE